MNLFEYQAKEIFSVHRIPVPRSYLVSSPSEVSDALDHTGVPCVVKAQILQGGRGKAGLIRFAASHEEAVAETDALLDNSANQIERVLIEEAIDFRKELYLSVTVDPVSASGLIIGSTEGGVEIETLAKTRPQSIVRSHFDLALGIRPFEARQFAYSFDLSPEVAQKVVAVLVNLGSIFQELDCEIAEINPLFVTSDDRLIAGDGKIAIDNNSLNRQTWIKEKPYQTEIERDAAREGIPYLPFDGDISLMCAGAGLTTTVFDLVHYEGGTIANYLEFGGPNYRKAVQAMELCLRTNPKVILIVTFGTIARADVMAQGVVEAITRLRPDVPIITCIRGTNEKEAFQTLKAAGLQPLLDTEEAVRRAVEISRKERRR